MNRLAALSLLLVLSCHAVLCGGEGAQYPSVALSNGQVRAQLYLPDEKNGYYRSSRFDWSSMVAAVEFAGHHYFADFKSPHMPTETDAASGFAEEFTQPLGYEQAEVGGAFLKIGAGVYTRPDHEPYRNFKCYPLRQAPSWTAKTQADAVVFEHAARLGEYAYTYTRAIKLDGAAILVTHRLQNCGKRTIKTAHYSHNFLSIASKPIGRDHSVSFNFMLMAGNKWDGFLSMEDHSLQFLREFEPAQKFLFTPCGVDLQQRNITVSLYDKQQRAGIAVQTDFALSSYFIYAESAAFCPEPFIDIELLPEQSQAWTTRYLFFSDKPMTFSADEIRKNSLCALRSVYLDGAPLPEFKADKLQYSVAVLSSARRYPTISAAAYPPGSSVSIRQATSELPTAAICVTPGNASGVKEYSIRFHRVPVKKVSASQTMGVVPESTVDGDPETSWPAGGDGQWIQYEFEREVTTSGLSIAWVGGDRRKFNFTVTGSTDGVAWRELFHGWSSGTTCNAEDVTYKQPVFARYIKIIGHGNTQSDVTNIADVDFHFADDRIAKDRP